MSDFVTIGSRVLAQVHGGDGLYVPEFISPRGLIRDWAKATDPMYRLIATKQISGSPGTAYIELLEARKRAAGTMRFLKGASWVAAGAGLVGAAVAAGRK